MKSIFQSRTFWLAIAQAIVGVVVTFFTNAGMAGEALLLKSFVDIMLRVYTTTPVREVVL